MKLLSKLKWSLLFAPSIFIANTRAVFGLANRAAQVPFGRTASSTLGNLEVQDLLPEQLAEIQRQVEVFGLPVDIELSDLILTLENGHIRILGVKDPESYSREELIHEYARPSCGDGK